MDDSSDQLNVARPFAAPASQHDASATVLTMDRVAEIMLACNVDYSPGMAAFVRTIEAEVVSRCRAQGGVTSSKPSSTAPTVEVDERAAFEVWASHPVRAEKLPLDRWTTNGGYKDQRTYIAYFAWKGALASRPPAEAAGERLSIDTPEFRKLLSRYLHTLGDEHAEAQANIITHIDSYLAGNTGERERELCATIGAMQAQIDALKGDLAARGAGDTELLDWLEESGHAYTTVSGKWVFSDQPFGNSGMTLREAIAMARQQG
jgi:hypothetical protein